VDFLGIGERIRELRRGVYSQIDLATAAEVSVDVIRKLEQGRRQTASIGTLQRIARVLDVDVGELLGRSRAVPSGSDDQARVWPIRDALTSVDDLLGELDDADAPDLAELDRSVSYAWGAYWAGRYGLLAAMLPRLLTEARAVTHGAAVPGGDRAVDLAAQVHQLAAGTLLRLGAADLGHVAARESLRWSVMAPDPLRDAAMRSTLVYVLIRQGRFLDAERVAVATAEACQPHDDATTPELSVYGGCCCVGPPLPRDRVAPGLLRHCSAKPGRWPGAPGSIAPTTRWCSGRRTGSCSPPTSPWSARITRPRSRWRGGCRPVPLSRWPRGLGI